jgi:DNA-binding transcriptional MocR family regulator
VSLKDVKSGKMKARPSKRRMQRELGMSNNTLNKYLKELREFGLIEVKQTRVLRDGRKEYGNNIYTLRSHVDFPLDGATSSLSGREIQKAKKLQSWIRDSWELNSLHASNTMSSNTNAQGGWSLSVGSNSDFSSLSLCTHSERLVDVP